MQRAAAASRRLAARLADQFGLEWEFIELPNPRVTASSSSSTAARYRIRSLADQKVAAVRDGHAPAPEAAARSQGALPTPTCCRGHPEITRQGPANPREVGRASSASIARAALRCRCAIPNPARNPIHDLRLEPARVRDAPPAETTVRSGEILRCAPDGRQPSGRRRRARISARNEPISCSKRCRQRPQESFRRPYRDGERPA